MKQTIKTADVWLWLTFPIGILLLIATTGGLFINDLYRGDNPYFATQAIGQDFISLVVVFPTLIISAFFSNRGSPRAKIIWLGVLIYLVYTYVVAAFDVSFNSLFLVYVALLGCTLYALIGGLVTANLSYIKDCFTEKTPNKAIGIYLAVLMALFYFLWLREVIPALMAGTIPQSIQENGTPTNAIHVLDMAWILPAFGITAISLWRKQALGYTLAGALLTYGVLLMLAILSMVVLIIKNGYLVAIPQVAIFSSLFLLSLGMLIWYLKGLRSSPGKNI